MGVGILGLLIALVVVFFAARSLLTRDPGEERVHLREILEEAEGRAGNALRWAWVQYLNHLRPRLVQLGWIAVVELLLALVFHLMVGLLNPLAMPLIFATASVTALFIAWILLAMRSGPTPASAVAVFARSTAALVATGIIYVACALLSGSHMMAFAGSILIYLGISIPRLLSAGLAMAGVKIVDIGEGSINSIRKVVQLIVAATGTQGAERILDMRWELGAQEDYRPAMRAFWLNVDVLIGPFLVIAIDFANPVIFALFSVAAFVQWIILRSYEGLGELEKVREIKLARVRQFAVIGMLGVVWIAIGAVSPVAENLLNRFVAACVLLVVGILGWITNLVEGLSQQGPKGFLDGIAFTDWRVALVVILFAVLALYYIVPRSRNASLYGVRVAGTMVLALVILFAVGGLLKAQKDGKLALSSPSHNASPAAAQSTLPPNVVLKTAPAATDAVPLPPSPVSTGTPCGKCQNDLQVHLDALKKFQ